MTPVEWQIVKRLFDACLNAPPEARAKVLAEADVPEAIRTETARLLNNLDGANDSFLQAPEAIQEVFRAPTRLAVGERLGPYEIVALIGRGGMGEVYRAHDSRLRRDVAIKVSAAQFSERFEREARAIAALNHPNICHLYDVGPNYLVMELVEGPTLAERLKQGAAPLETAIGIAKQIADALEAAHDKGIVHRDLKPANLKITPEGVVKVLDFGLAKPVSEPSQFEDKSSLSTEAMSLTQAGAILGTTAYMAPEQARGNVTDKRADIWAFGVVLYELLTGRRPFHGDDTMEILASVVRDQPNFSVVPQKFQRLLQRCLEKDPRTRLRDIGDAIPMLEDAPNAPAGAGTFHRVAYLVAISALSLALLGLTIMHFRGPLGAEPIRFQVPPPANSAFDIYLALSPDGRRLAFTASGANGVVRIWIRDLGTLEARVLNGTEGAASIIWSPDSTAIAFAVGQQLKKIDVVGGPAQTLCDSPNAIGSGAWSKAGVIVFGGRGAGPLRQVSEVGGAPSPVTVLDSVGYHSFPSFLPDGRHFIYYLSAGGSENQGIYLGSLDSKPEVQHSQRLVATRYGAVYAPSVSGGSGQILFLRDGTLMALPLDAKRLQITGDATPVAERVGNTNQYGNFSASNNGGLAYRTGSVGNTQFTWLDRKGKALGTVGEAGQYTTLRLSPDATRAAVRRSPSGDLSLLEFARGGSTRFTFTQAGVNDSPVWSQDGRYIVFKSNRSGRYDLYRKASNGTGEDEILLRSDQDKTPTSISHDGRFLLFSSADPKTAQDIWVLPLEGDRKPIPFLSTAFDESLGAFSPDGHWIAYVSNESGPIEVYVLPFTPPGPGGAARGAAAGKQQVSNGGSAGATPFWRADGKELYYRSPSGVVMAVDVSANPAFQHGTPHRLFDALANYLVDGTPDAERFLVGLPPDSGPQAITVVLNWQSALKK